MPDPASLRASDPDGRSLRLEFLWRGDRYGHELHVDTEANTSSSGAANSRETTRAAAVSIEGTAHETLPTSPAFQQLLVEDRGARGRVALLVGMSGTTHWSASVEPLPGRAAWLFDVACRVRELPQFSSSAYRRSASSGTEASADDAAPRVVFVPESPTYFRETPDGLVELVSECRETKTPCTLRWRYVVTLDE